MPIPQLKKRTEDKDAQEHRYDKTWREVLHARREPSNGFFPRLMVFFTTMARRGWKKIRGGVRGRAGKRGLLRFWLPIAGICFLAGVLLLIIVFAWFSRDLPDPNRISDRNVAQSTRIYARDGTTLLYQIHGDERRTVVELGDIAPDVVNATVAIEDKDFYKHRGFSLTGILRAIFRDITTGSSQGGSTITQQFVKNAILTSEKRVTRKIRELVLSYQIERRFTKQQILKLYFNEIPYGSNAYGIEAAAETYFGKSAKSLTLAEASVLAALPQAPTFYSPYGNHADRLLARAHYVLDIMVEQGYITKEQADAAKAVDVLANVKPKRESIVAPHFIFYVREQLSDKYGEKTVEQEGLRVVTTLDIDKQVAAEQAVTEQGDINEKKYHANNASLVALDPKTGQVLAMVGSRDYFNAAIDGNVNVALAPRQPGSSIKPIVYATAFSVGFTPETILFDLTTHFKIPGAPDYVPQNYDNREHGPLPMRNTLAGSLNIPAVKTLYLTGIDRVIDQAQKMGYTTWEDRSRLGLSLTLGGAEVKLIEHVAAFGAIAGDGVLHPTTPILRVEDKNGKVLEEYQNQNSRVLDENVARTVIDVLSDNSARSFIFGSRSKLILPDRPVAAKTGTTQEFRDGWTVGFTPSIVTGVWVGNSRNEKMVKGADGVVVAAPIWNSFMRKVLAGTKAESFKKPKSEKPTKPILQGKLEGESPIKVDRVTGKEIPSSCVEKWPKDFVVEKTVKAVHTILYYVTPGDPTGSAPKNPEKDLQFASWEEPVQRWAKEHKYVEKHPSMESCDLRSKQPVVTIVSPTTNETVRSESVAVSISVESGRAISRTEFSIDGKVLVTSPDAETSSTLGLSNLKNGFHTITVHAYDDVDNVGEASVNVNILKDLSQSSVYFMNPQNNATVSNGSPVDLAAFVYDPEGVSEATFSSSAQAGSPSDIAYVAVDSSSVATTSWTPAAPGTYRLSVRGITKSGKALQSDYLTVTVR